MSDKKFPHILLKRNPDRDKFIPMIISLGFKPKSKQDFAFSTQGQLWHKDSFEIKLTNENIEFDGDFYQYTEQEMLFRNLKLKNII